MKKTAPANRTNPASGSGSASGAGEGAGASLVGGLVEPLAALALREGMQLPALIDALKLALVRTAGREPAVSDSRIAVMTGVHRKDVRRIRSQGVPNAPRGASIAMQVFARWRSDPRYLTSRGQPRQLPRQASGGDSDMPSFESLAGAVTRDVHPRAVLDELLRLAIAQTRPGDRVQLVRTAFVPVSDDQAMVALAAANLGDHAAAIAANLADSGPRFLEQAIFSDEFSSESAKIFNQRSLQAWEQVFMTMMPLARALFEADRNANAVRGHRVRLGMYSWAAPTEANDSRSSAAHAGATGAGTAREGTAREGTARIPRGPR